MLYNGESHPRVDEMKVHLLIPAHDGSGVYLIKGQHTWRMPRVIISGTLFEIAWKHSCFLTDVNATAKLKFCQTIIDPESSIIPGEFMIKTKPPLSVPVGMKNVPWEVIMDRKLSVQTKLLLIVWFGAVIPPDRVDSSMSQLVDCLSSAILQEV